MLQRKDQEVTTHQAADFLKVSRPYFVKLREEGRSPLSPGWNPPERER